MRKLQSQERARSHMSFARADAAGQIQLGNVEPEILAKIGGGSDDVTRKLEPCITALPDDRSVRLGIRGLESEVLAIDADCGDFLDANRWIDAQEGLCRSDAQLG